jgi:DNA-binding transcriptional MerR regulator
VSTKTITQVAAAAGVSSDTLRYYEKLRLVAPVARTQAGYRLYDDRVGDRLRLIKGAQRSGLRLHDIRQLLDIKDQGGCPCGHTETLVANRIAAVDAERRRLTELRSQLVDLSELARTCPDPSGWACESELIKKGGGD